MKRALMLALFVGLVLLGGCASTAQTDGTSETQNAILYSEPWNVGPPTPTGVILVGSTGTGGSILGYFSLSEPYNGNDGFSYEYANKNVDAIMNLCWGRKCQINCLINDVDAIEEIYSFDFLD